MPLQHCNFILLFDSFIMHRICFSNTHLSPAPVSLQRPLCLSHSGTFACVLILTRFKQAAHLDMVDLSTGAWAFQQASDAHSFSGRARPHDGLFLLRPCCVWVILGRCEFATAKAMSCPEDTSQPSSPFPGSYILPTIFLKSRAGPIYGCTYIFKRQFDHRLI